jgi:hypothetical protein
MEFKMKKIFWIMAIFMFSFQLSNAQEIQQAKQNEEPELKTLFGGDGFKSSGYGGPQVKFSNINGDIGILVGGRGAWTVNRTLSLGLAGYGLITQHDAKYVDTAGKNIDGVINMGYGGLYLEYIYKPIEYVHLATNVLVGAGAVNFSEEMWHSDSSDDEFDTHSNSNKPWKAIFVIEPTVAVEFNITTYFRISIEGSYRFVSSIRENDLYKANQTLKDINLNGFSGGITLEFGCF